MLIFIGMSGQLIESMNKLKVFSKERKQRFAVEIDGLFHGVW